MIIGVLVASALSVVGTDEVTEAEPFIVEDGAYAVVLDQAIVPYSGTDVTVTATASDGSELFLGTANGVDTNSYLDGVAQVQIDDVDFPRTAEHRFIPGDPAPTGTITDQDWWTSQVTGTTVEKTFDLDAEPQVLVIAPTGKDATLEGVTVSMQMHVKGVFALSLIGVAVGILLLGAAAYFFLRWRAGRIRPRQKVLGTETTGGRG